MTLIGAFERIDSVLFDKLSHSLTIFHPHINCSIQFAVSLSECTGSAIHG